MLLQITLCVWSLSVQALLLSPATSCCAPSHDTQQSYIALKEKEELTETEMYLLKHT